MSVPSALLTRAPCRAGLVVLLVLSAAIIAQASEPLSGAIDAQVRERWQQAGVSPAPRCDDATFVRRAYLDLLGRIPTLAERQAFLDDTATDKRSRLVDQLLASPELGRHFREVFDVVLMGRGRPDSFARRAEFGWHAFLERSFNSSRPWDEVCREILLARPQRDDDRGATWFLFERQEKYQEIAEAVSPAIFGVQIQCAQCHDHPLAEEIEQRHYWGLVSFFNRGKAEMRSGKPQVIESAIGGFHKYASLTGESLDAELVFLGGRRVDEARPADVEKMEDAPDLYHDAGGMRVPKFSRREKFVDEVLRDHPLVARAMVNRLWGMLMGRGIVHPIDQLDSKHPPSHPELLDLLADDFRERGYNVKRTLRAIMLSETYQLSSQRSDAAVDPALFSHAIERPLTAEAYYRSMQVALTQQADPPLDSEILADFRRLFPDVLAEEPTANLRQSLYLTNNERFQGLFAAAEGKTPEALFLAFFGRDMAADEREAVKAIAPRHLAWALATSAEFRFNH